MLATKLNNYVQLALSRLLQQYQGRTLITGVYTAIAQECQDLENAIFSLDGGRQLWNGTSTPAYGQQLDGIGEIVGISRNGLDDQQYILFLFGKIAENFSDGTIESVLAVIQYLFQGQIIIQAIYPAGLYVNILNPLIPQSLYPLVESLIMKAVGAGIKIVFTGTPPAPPSPAPPINVFRFAGPGVSGALNGFGDLNVPDSGGVFVGLI